MHLRDSKKITYRWIKIDNRLKEIKNKKYYLKSDNVFCFVQFFVVFAKVDITLEMSVPVIVYL